MGEAVADGFACVRLDVWTVHWLKQEILERQMREVFGWCSGLRIYQLQLVAAGDFKLRSGLRADTNPVDPRGRRQRSIGFDRDPEASLVKRTDEIFVYLKQWFATGENTQAIASTAHPFRLDRVGQLISIVVSTSLRTIDTDKIGIAKTADRVLSIGFAPRPQIAARKSAEDRGATGLHAFTLKSQKYLFYRK